MFFEWIQVRSFDSEKAFDDEIKKFEHSCLGEVRLLGVLSKHPCIVEIYGHQLSSKWAPSANGTQMHRSLQFRLITEFVEGGSLKVYLFFICMLQLMFDTVTNNCFDLFPALLG